jgi:hypothetical protein
VGEIAETRSAGGENLITKIVVTAVRGKYRVSFTMDTRDETDFRYDETVDSMDQVLACIRVNQEREMEWDDEARELSKAVVT